MSEGLRIPPVVLAPPQKPSLAQAILLRMREAAELLAISERTLWSIVARKELPAVRVGRLVRIRRADLEAWAAARASTRKSAS
jgi:excisionase family DNA binding protein